MTSKRNAVRPILALCAAIVLTLGGAAGANAETGIPAPVDPAQAESGLGWWPIVTLPGEADLPEPGYSTPTEGGDITVTAAAEHEAGSYRVGVCDFSSPMPKCTGYQDSIEWPGGAGLSGVAGPISHYGNVNDHVPFDLDHFDCANNGDCRVVIAKHEKLVVHKIVEQVDFNWS